jgi:hypothetical protein
MEQHQVKAAEPVSGPDQAEQPVSPASSNSADIRDYSDLSEDYVVVRGID